MNTHQSTQYKPPPRLTEISVRWSVQRVGHDDSGTHFGPLTIGLCALFATFSVASIVVLGILATGGVL